MSLFRLVEEIAPGHSRRFDRPSTTSGLPQRTDTLRLRRHVSKVPDSEVPDFCDAIALHVRKSPKSRRYLSSAQGQIQRQNQLERPKSLPEVKMIDCTETATNLTQTVAIRL